MPENAKPAGFSGGHRILVSDWKAHEKNTLRGFLSVTLPSGLILRNCTLHEKDGARWIGLPAKPYTREDGSASYISLIEFNSGDVRRRFQAAALEAVERFMEGGRHV